MNRKATTQVPEKFLKYMESREWNTGVYAIIQLKNINKITGQTVYKYSFLLCFAFTVLVTRSFTTGWQIPDCMNLFFQVVNFICIQ